MAGDSSRCEFNSRGIVGCAITTLLRSKWSFSISCFGFGVGGPVFVAPLCCSAWLLWGFQGVEG